MMRLATQKKKLELFMKWAGGKALKIMLSAMMEPLCKGEKE